MAGIAIISLTSKPGDPAKIEEIRNLKESMRRESDRQLQKSMSNVEAWASLDGIGFERAVAIVYRERQFEVQFTPRTNDKGVDLIFTRDGELSIVQCKAYAKTVGVAAVRELAGARAGWPHAKEAIVVTLFDFSREAKASPRSTASVSYRSPKITRRQTSA